MLWRSPSSFVQLTRPPSPIVVSSGPNAKFAIRTDALTGAGAGVGALGAGDGGSAAAAATAGGVVADGANDHVGAAAALPQAAARRAIGETAVTVRTK